MLVSRGKAATDVIKEKTELIDDSREGILGQRLLGGCKDLFHSVGDDGRVISGGGKTSEEYEGEQGQRGMAPDATMPKGRGRTNHSAIAARYA